MNFRMITAGLIALSLSGCVIVTDRDDFDDDNRSSWRQTQRDNLDAIERLELGMNFDSVRDEVGRPDFTEKFTREGREYRILRYRTHHRHSDGETTRDETTPVVFQDGLLIGWGEIALANVE